MKNLKRLAAAALTTLILITSCALPASAEGFTFNWDVGDGNTEPHCKSLVLLNLDTDSIVYTLNPDEELPMASMTKIMTYIVAWETIPNLENTVITMPQSVEDDLVDTGSSVADMWPGESFLGRDLLYMMMVPSGNNAALTLAKHTDSLYAQGLLPADQEYDALAAQAAANGMDPAGYGSTDYTGVSYFVYLMNKKAKELGCSHTHFTNPHGLHHEKHYASARDMAAITKYAMGLPNFMEIVGTTAWNYSPQNSPDEVRTAHTTNKMLTNNIEENTGLSYYYSLATGIKTGSLDEAGYCITASATAYGYTYVAVAMGDMEGYNLRIHREMQDCATLFRWALTSLEKKTVAVQGDLLTSVKLKYAWKKDELQLASGENAAVMLPESVDSTSIQIEPDVPESVEAPVRKGEQIGTATLSYAGEVIATVPLVASESVAKSEALQVWEQGQDVLTAPWFLMIMAVILVLVVVYIILILLYRRKQKQLRRVKRFRDM